MVNRDQFLRACESVFTRFLGWPEATPEIVQQRLAVWEAFERNEGWTLCPIECSGGKSTMARIYTALDTERWVVAVNTIAECEEFVEGWEKILAGIGSEEARMGGRTIRASTSENSWYERIQARDHADVIVVCHNALKLAMGNPYYAKQIGISDRKICIDEEITLVSGRQHAPKEIKSFTRRISEWVYGEGRDRFSDEELDSFRQDIADIEFAHEVCNQNESRDSFCEGFLSYTARTDSDGRDFPRILEQATEQYIDHADFEDWDEQAVVSLQRRMNSIIAMCSSVVRNVGMAIRTHDDQSADSYARIFQGESIVPRGWKQAVVLDGTASVRPRVHQTEENPLGALVPGMSYVQETGRVRDYSNVVVDVVYGGTSSERRILQNDRGAFTALEKNLNEIIKNSSGEKTLVLTGKDLARNLTKNQKSLYWNKHFSCGMTQGAHAPGDSNVVLGYWNMHHRGRNDLMDCDRGYIFSLPNKPYWCAALPVLIQRGGMGDVDEFTEAVRKEEFGALCSEVIQGINRIKHRGLLLEDGVMKTPKSRFTVFLPNSGSVGCVDGTRRTLAELLVWLLEHEMPGVQINYLKLEESTEQVEGVVDRQDSAKGRGERGIAKKWQPLLDAVQLGLGTDSEYEITDSMLLDLCPFLGSLDKVRNAKKNLKRQCTLEKGLGSRGLEVSVASVAGRGLVVSLAA